MATLGTDKSGYNREVDVMIWVEIGVQDMTPVFSGVQPFYIISKNTYYSIEIPNTIKIGQ